MIDLTTIEGFEWDDGNLYKNFRIKPDGTFHYVLPRDCEEVIFNTPLFFTPDPKHSLNEERINAYGKNDADRLLHLTFTVRNNKIRIISARDMSREERKFYETAAKL
jgi:uncharacterized DUF497 family protein